MEIIPAEEVCEYTYKVELIEINKISIVVFNTTTGIKYQRYIEEYSEAWEDIKTKFQNNFSLCFKMLTKALIDNNPTFTVSILHKIDYVVFVLYSHYLCLFLTHHRIQISLLIHRRICRVRMI